MMEKCPKCKQETLDYMDDHKSGEAENWGCTNNDCEANFKVPTQITRDWNNIEEQANG